MTLIKSISGIRGTIGGIPGSGLTPPDVVRFTAAFGTWMLQTTRIKKVIVGRDARISGGMYSGLVHSTLQALGISVVDLGLATTPTVGMAVPAEKAGGGIILTASHNPFQWNALKLLNRKGEFIAASEGEKVLALADSGTIDFAGSEKLGGYKKKDGSLAYHIRRILSRPLVDRKAIRKAGLRVVVDAVNSVGGIAVPALLKALGVRQVIKLYCNPDGNFPHNPEPLPENLKALSAKVRRAKAHLGIAVDPDVDRLALVCGDGSMFGEEYTLVAVADYILSRRKGSVVSNLSSSRALKDVVQMHGCSYYASAVGEVHVVEKMKAVKAVIGGEGNGGVIWPELHYGRDALAGIALFLSHLARSGKSCSALRASYPSYYMEKTKIRLGPAMKVENILHGIREKYSRHPVNTEDGVRIDFEPSGWVHLRRSNTEPIIRIYAEGITPEEAHDLAVRIRQDVQEMTQVMKNA